MNERIVCAAICKDGRIICAPRHYDSIMHDQILNTSEGTEYWRSAEQGFVNQRGNFLTREEARIVAIKENQILRRCGGDTKRLFSENLY